MSLKRSRFLPTRAGSSNNKYKSQISSLNRFLEKPRAPTPVLRTYTIRYTDILLSMVHSPLLYRELTSPRLKSQVSLLLPQALYQTSLRLVIAQNWAFLEVEDGSSCPRQVSKFRGIRACSWEARLSFLLWSEVFSTPQKRMSLKLMLSCSPNDTVHFTQVRWFLTIATSLQCERNKRTHSKYSWRNTVFLIKTMSSLKLYFLSIKSKRSLSRVTESITNWK